MGITILRPSDRGEWLKLREKGIGSSEVATILGLNPFETPYQLWRRKLGLDMPKEENFAMRAGHYLEDAVSKFYQDATGRNIIKASAGDWLIRSGEYPYMQVSPDRTYWIPGMRRSKDNKGILECKTTQMEIDADLLPHHWFVQLQYQMGVSGYREGSIAWLTQGRNFGYKDFEYDSDFFGYMAEEVRKFWEDNIVGKQEPLLMTVEDVMLKNPRHVEGKKIEADVELEAECIELRMIKEELARISKRKEELESSIKFAMNDSELLMRADKVLATWRATKGSERFDEKRFARENPELYSRYKVTGQGTRRFVLK